MKEIDIEQYSDGWSIELDGKSFSWNHNDEDMGVSAIKNLLEHLGHDVEIRECY